MTSPVEPAATQPRDTVAAGKLSAWDVGQLPHPPSGGWRTWLQLLGPGVLLAGASIGSGEWLSGPAISAQYGGTLLWVASLSILAQVFCNLEMMRYALYCGEPVMVGFFRTAPGPRFWLAGYLVLDFAAIWPFNASNAAVPLAAALLGHLPSDAMVSFLTLSFSERQLVKVLGYAIFLLAFLPLIFGGTIYRMLERVFALKLAIVLGYLLFVAAFMVSGPTAREVCFGFISFGQIPLRADTIVAGRHFNLLERNGNDWYRVKGTMENDRPLVTEFIVHRDGEETPYQMGQPVPADLADRRSRLVARAEALAQPGTFYVEHIEGDAHLAMHGRIAANLSWEPAQITVRQGNVTREYDHLDELSSPLAEVSRELVANQGLKRVGMLGYLSEHGRLPRLDWAMVATFAAIAGAGGMTNTLFSNYAREKGWGMGRHVGAIPSAIGGKTISLSHVGRVFRLDADSRARWRGWLRHVYRDQLAIWMVCSFIGMALPCMLSLEFIRHAPVSGDRVAAMTAEGMATRYPQHAELLWFVTLLVGFLVLAPGQIMAGDQISRRWTDIIWTSSQRAQKLPGDRVKYVYYGILLAYCIWGLFALTLFDPLQILKIAGVLMNFALGSSALHTLYVNRTLLPAELRPNWIMQTGTLLCGIFFLGISVIVIAHL
ncbi:MAG: Nramp family divalent metal transporter [Pirellulales bacterium]